MGSDAGCKVGGPRENLTIITKDFFKNTIVLKKALFFCKKVRGPLPPPPERLFVGGPGCFEQETYRFLHNMSYKTKSSIMFMALSIHDVSIGENP